MNFKKYLAALIIALFLSSILLLIPIRRFLIGETTTDELPAHGYQTGSGPDIHTDATEGQVGSPEPVQVGQAADEQTVHVDSVQKTDAVPNSSQSGIDSVASRGKVNKASRAKNPLLDLLARVNIDPKAPVLLTSGDIDPESVRVPGTNSTDVMLWLKIPGKSPDELEVITTFAGGDVLFEGQVIKRGPSRGAAWVENGTNVGIVMLYGTRAEASAVAKLLRGASR
jgi:hypothetical protein